MHYILVAGSREGIDQHLRPLASRVKKLFLGDERSSTDWAGPIEGWSLTRRRSGHEPGLFSALDVERGRAAEKCDMTREQTVRALSGIIQAKPMGQVSRIRCEMV
jgi:hypothetical protein